ncbi:MAG: hypothetical protein ABI866_01390 [Dokdonella sp.]
MRIHLAALAMLMLAPAAQASNYVVSTTADSGAGSLRQAILDSNAPAGGVHTMIFSAAFPNNGVILLDSNLPQIVSQSLIIMGDSKRPSISGKSLHALFSVSTSTSVFELSDLVLKNAKATEKGGCINSGNGSTAGQLRVEHVTFINCQAVGPSLITGGAIHWSRSSGTLTVIDSQFLDNAVTATASNGESSGGAIYTNANVSIVRTLFDSNAAFATTGGGLGGAIALFGTQRNFSITESTFRLNAASPAAPLFGYGGAVYVYCDNCSTQIVRSYLRGNSANFGGAVFARKSSDGGPSDVFLNLANSTFYNGSVLNIGGAVFVGSGASLSASNNTFYNGDASDGAHLGFTTSATVNYFRGNLLAPTYAGAACSGTPTISNATFVGFNVFSDASCTSLNSGALPNSPLGTVMVDERPGQIGVLRFSGSAVIDSITNGTICEPRDARFQIRPIDGNGDGLAYCDVGAYEDPRDIIFINDFEA